MTSSTTTRAYGAWVAVCLLWGTSYLGIRITLETIPPLLMGGLRWTSAGALIIAILTLRGERLPPRTTWPSLILLGILLIVFGNGFVVLAERTLPSGLTAVLAAALPFWMVGFERLFVDRTPLSTWKIAGLAVGFSGIVLLVWPDLELGAGGSFLVAVACTQLACLGWTIGSSYSRRRRPGENVIAAAAVQMFFGGMVMLAAGALHGELPRLAFTARTGGALLYLIVFGSLAGFSAYTYALKHLPVATVSLYAYVNPVIAMALGTVVLGEPLSPRLAAAGAVVLAGMAMVRK